MTLEEDNLNRDKINRLRHDLSRLANSREIFGDDKIMAQIYLTAMFGERLKEYTPAFELVKRYEYILSRSR